jgi:hypothetical protein
MIFSFYKVLTCCQNTLHAPPVKVNGSLPAINMPALSSFVYYEIGLRAVSFTHFRVNPACTGYYGHLAGIFLFGLWH